MIYIFLYVKIEIISINRKKSTKDFFFFFLQKLVVFRIYCRLKWKSNFLQRNNTNYLHFSTFLKLKFIEDVNFKYAV